MMMMRFDFITCKNAINKTDQLLKTPSNVGRCNSTRMDEEGRKCSLLLAIKMKARADVRRGQEGTVCDPRSELLLGRSVRVVRG